MSDKDRENRATQTGRASTPPPPNPGGPSLAEMTGVGLYSSALHAPKLRIATIASDALHAELEAHYLAIPLFPDTVIHSINSAKPDFVVIQRAALNQGPWFGAEFEAGGLLASEVVRLGKWSKKYDRRIIYIDSPEPQTYYSNDIRSMADFIFPNADFWNELPERPRRRLIFSICESHGLGDMKGSEFSNE